MLICCVIRSNVFFAILSSIWRNIIWKKSNFSRSWRAALEGGNIEFLFFSFSQAKCSEVKGVLKNAGMVSNQSWEYFGLWASIPVHQITRGCSWPRYNPSSCVMHKSNHPLFLFKTGFNMYLKHSWSITMILLPWPKISLHLFCSASKSPSFSF